MGLASCFILGEHQAFNAFGLTVKAFALTSVAFGVTLIFGVDNSLILSVAVRIHRKKIRAICIQFIDVSCLLMILLSFAIITTYLVV